MEALILLIIFGLGAAYFATQNTGTVHILLGGYIASGIPLYIIVIGSILLGVFMSWLVSIVNELSTFFTLSRKEASLRKLQKTVDDLQRKNRELETELARVAGNENISFSERGEEKKKVDDES